MDGKRGTRSDVIQGGSGARDGATVGAPGRAGRGGKRQPREGSARFASRTRDGRAGSSAQGRSASTAAAAERRRGGRSTGRVAAGAARERRGGASAAARGRRRAGGGLSYRACRRTRESGDEDAGARRVGVAASAPARALSKDVALSARNFTSHSSRRRLRVSNV